VDFASFNVAQPPFDDVAVRRAVAIALDRDAFVAARVDAGFQARVATHFSSDTFESSLIAGWSGLSDGRGEGDLTAARDAMRASRYARGGRCADPACDGVEVIVNEETPKAVRPLRRALGALGIEAVVHPDDPFACTDPERHVGMCAGLGWTTDYPSADNYLRPFFHSEAVFPVTQLGASPTDLRRWGYDVRHVPSADERIDRCARDTTSSQAACWARLDQYLVSELVPAVPLSFIDVLRVSTPRLGPFPWDQILQQPALDRIATPVEASG
jgi:ABC-type oligopeptide transport system substrate-binding subunit